MALQSPSQPVQWTFWRVVWATLVLVFVGFSFWLLYRFYQVVFILFVAFVIGTVIRPVVTWLHRRGLPKITGIILVYVLLLALLIGFVLLLFPSVVEQAATIAASVPDTYENLREWMADSPNAWMIRLSEFLPATLPGLAPATQTGEQVLASAEQAMVFLASAGKAILIATAILLLAFHWTLEGPRTIQFFLPLLPKGHRAGIAELISAMENKVGLYLIGQSVLCLVIGAMALVTYLLLDLPNALVLALLAGLMEAIPMIGPVLGAIPAGARASGVSSHCGLRPSSCIFCFTADAGTPASSMRKYPPVAIPARKRC